MATAKEKDLAYARKVGAWMKTTPELYAMVLRTALGLEQGTLSDREHKAAKRRAKLALDVFNGVVS